MTKPAQDRLDYAQDGSLDDATIHDVEMFRIERMDAGLYWMRLYCSGKPDVILWIRADGANQKISAAHELGM